MTSQTVRPEVLARLNPLSGLRQDSLSQLVSLAWIELFPRSGRPMQFAWTSRVVYLLKGELKLDYPGGGVKVLVGGYDEALFPLGRGGVDPIGAKPITDVELLWFDENALDILVTWDQAASPATVQDDDRGLDSHGMSGILNARRLTRGAFANLPAAHYEALLKCFKRQAVTLGEVIVRQGESGDFYYVIERGRAEVTRTVGGATIRLAELDAGDAFGEEALIAETSRNATVTMLTDGELLRLDNADFVSLLREPLLRRIAPDQAVRRVASGSVWLDVRFPAEYRDDGLPGAINIPLNELRDALPNLSPDTEYIVYCQTGRRSSAAAFLLSRRGLNARLLDGGLKAMNSKEKIPA